MTPDGRHVVAGSIAGRVMTVIDQKTEEPAWTLFDDGVRPMAFETNPDGSTKRIFVQLSDLHGFAVVDFAAAQGSGARSSCRTTFRPSKVDKGPFNASPSHGLGVAPDGRTLWVTSRPNARVYAYSLPDLKLLGSGRSRRAPGLGDVHARQQTGLHLDGEHELGGRWSMSPARKEITRDQGRRVAEAEHHSGAALTGPLAWPGGSRNPPYFLPRFAVR